MELEVPFYLLLFFSAYFATNLIYSVEDRKLKQYIIIQYVSFI